MKRIAVLAVMAVLAAPRWANAEVYRCVAGGQVTYTDQACSPEASPAALPAINTTAPATVQTQRLAHQYDQESASEAKARRSAQADEAARHFARRADEERIRKALVDGRIVPGMTREQVERVLNLPTRVEHPGGPRERWTYRNGRERRTIVFRDGLVISDRVQHGRR